MWLPKRLSVSAVDLYSKCPAAYERRYVHGVMDPPSGAMAFGRAMAKALEAEHRGEDGDVAWVRAYQAEVLPGSGAPSATHGLRLLAAYRQRGIGQGTPEQRFEFHLPDRDAVPVPILGYMDLMTDTEIYEFKTSRARWDQGRCDASDQATVYAWAYNRLTGRKPQGVRFLILDTRDGSAQPLTEFVTYPASGQVRLFELKAAAVWRAVMAGQFPPTCKRPDCVACLEAGAAPARQPTKGGMFEW